MGVQRVASKALAICLGILTGRNQHNVKADVALGIFGLLGQPKLRGGDNAALAAFGHGFGCVGGGLTRLHLDEYQRMPTAGDNVDLAERRFPAPRRDPVTLGDQNQRRATFRG